MHISPGDRLKAFRIDAGYPTIADFHRALRDNCMPVRYHCLKRFEADEKKPNPYELDAICDTLGITSDCWQRGVCDNPLGELAQMAHQLTDRQISILLELNHHQISFIKSNH